VLFCVAIDVHVTEIVGIDVDDVGEFGLTIFDALTCVAMLKLIGGS